MGKVTGLIFLDTIPETHACPDCGKEYKSREAHICGFADDTEHLTGLARLDISKQQSNFVATEGKTLYMLVSNIIRSLGYGFCEADIPSIRNCFQISF